ncbi:MAG: hypothetical protein SVG88_14355 [Halobacteriales archaeon]|nr:hypothetical protein [Halobacteriales archaeon]
MSTPDPGFRPNRRLVRWFVIAIVAIIGLGIVLDVVIVGTYLFTPLAIVVAVLTLGLGYMLLTRRDVS